MQYIIATLLINKSNEVINNSWVVSNSLFYHITVESLHQDTYYLLHYRLHDFHTPPPPPPPFVHVHHLTSTTTNNNASSSNKDAPLHPTIHVILMTSQIM